MGNKQLAKFWTVAFALAWLLTIPPAVAQLGLIESSPIPAGLGVSIGIAPAIAAWVASRHDGQKDFWRSMFRRPSPFWTSVVAIALPPAMLAIAYGVSAFRGHPIKVELGTHLFVFGALWLLLAFTEEIGWRGFALPRLVEKYGYWSGSLILGIAWCIWHYPKLLSSPYLGTIAEAAPLIALFSIQIVISNFILCWLYLRSGGSVLSTTLFHASFNIVATSYFLAATDLVITGLLTLVAIAIAVFDNPSSLPLKVADCKPASDTSRTAA